MIIEMYERDQLSKSEIDELWEADINMDDWDFVLIVDVDDYENSFWLSSMFDIKLGVEWHDVEYRGKRRMVGVAYHA